MFKTIRIVKRGKRGDSAAGVAAQPNCPAGAARQGRSSRGTMFKKILIANRGDSAAGVAAQPNCPAGAAR
jgi:hypothetical protein